MHHGLQRHVPSGRGLLGTGQRPDGVMGSENANWFDKRLDPNTYAGDQLFTDNKHEIT